MNRSQRRKRGHHPDRRARRARMAAGAGLSLGAAFGAAGPAQAADFVVDDTGDAGPGTLRDAVEQANLTTASDRVLFQAGLTGTIGLTSGEIVIEEPLEVIGPGAGALAVSGGGTQRVFVADSTQPINPDVSISGLTMTQGSATDPGAGAGGAVYSYGVDLTIDSSVVSDSYADDGGGGVAAISGDLSVLDSTVSGNNAVAGGGGPGGGVFAFGGGAVRIDGSTIRDNDAAAIGGGLATPYSASVLVTDTTIADNLTVAPGSFGGGMASAGAASVRVVSSTISGNTSVESGGGIYSVSEPLRIERSTVSGNDAEYAGGGLSAYFGTVDIVESTIGDNEITQGGGVGGGIFLCDCASARVRGSIVADNRTPGPDEDVFLSGGAPLDAAFTLIESPVGQGSVNETVAGSNILGVDPELTALADNGGPTQTQAPSAGSPVIDKGSAPGVAFDQRGLPRAVTQPGVAKSAAAGADCADMGAFELGLAGGGTGLPCTPAPLSLTCADRKVTIVATRKKTIGTPGNDVIFGTNKRDVIKGKGGKDLICGRGGADRILGGPGNDRLFGGDGNDTLIGGPGKNGLRPGRGKDTLIP